MDKKEFDEAMASFDAAMTEFNKWHRIGGICITILTTLMICTILLFMLSVVLVHKVIPVLVVPFAATWVSFFVVKFVTDKGTHWIQVSRGEWNKACDKMGKPEMKMYF